MHLIQVTLTKMNGRDILHDEVIQQIADQHGKTPAQTILRWHLQTGVIVIPKSATSSRIKGNLNVFDFELTAEEMEKISVLDRNIRTNGVPSEVN